MFYQQYALLRGIDKETLENRKLIERTCLMGTSCANIRSKSSTLIHVDGNSYDYTYLSSEVSFMAHVQPSKCEISISLHSTKGQEGMNYIVDHIVKILNPDLDKCEFNMIEIN